MNQPLLLKDKIIWTFIEIYNVLGWRWFSGRPTRTGIVKLILRLIRSVQYNKTFRSSSSGGITVAKDGDDLYSITLSKSFLLDIEEIRLLKKQLKEEK